MPQSSNIEQHYEALLGSHYTWMMGGLERCLADARQLVERTGIGRPPLAAPVLDLGCGPGYHARTLAERGRRVIAVDLSETCLRELRELCAGLDVVPVHADLLDAGAYEQHGPFAAVVCVGDTLTHLEIRDQVLRLLELAQRLLAPDGALVVEFREQPGDLIAADAVLPLRAERDRIMQCVLHFERDRVWVTDVLYEWTGDAWKCTKSSYPKLRLTSGEIVREAEARGLRLAWSETRAGRRVLLLRKGDTPGT